jgi:hypothetical protein
MSLSRHGLLAFWLALQLLLAQQFALAHHVDHSARPSSRTPARRPTVEAGDEESESAAHVLAHVCTTCLAGLCFTAALAGSQLASHAIGVAPAVVAGAVLPAPTLDRPLAFHSRAPPTLQD